MSDLPLIIVPAAGSSKRFKDAGIDIPKGLIEFKYYNHKPRPMIKHIFNWPQEHIIVASNDERYDNGQWDFSYIGESKGQADTVRQVCLTYPNRPVLVLNNDCKIDYPLDVFYNQCKWASAGTLVFNGHKNSSYSYVENIPLFKNAFEKQPVTPWAMAGVYYFSNSNELVQAISKQMQHEHGSHAGEYYLSGTFDFIKNPKLAVIMPEYQFHSWGTPEDLARDPYVKVTDPKIEAILATMR